MHRDSSGFYEPENSMSRMPKKCREAHSQRAKAMANSFAGSSIARSGEKILVLTN